MQRFISIEEYERLFVQSGRAYKREARVKKGHQKVVDEAFARVKIDQLLESADEVLIHGYSLRLSHPLDDDEKATSEFYGCQSRALAMLETKSTSVNVIADVIQYWQSGCRR